MAIRYSVILLQYCRDSYKTIAVVLQLLYRYYDTITMVEIFPIVSPGYNGNANHMVEVGIGADERQTTSSAYTGALKAGSTVRRWFDGALNQWYLCIILYTIYYYFCICNFSKVSLLSNHKLSLNHIQSIIFCIIICSLSRVE